MSGEKRKLIINAIDEACETTLSIERACSVIGLDSRRLRRWRHKVIDGRRGGYRAVNQKLSREERLNIVEKFSNPDYANLAIRVAHAKLADEGVYIASAASCIRVINEDCVKKERRSSPSRVRPELKATGPNQVWCWDITWLPTSVRGKYFYLYLIIDMYSKYIVDWEVHSTEDGELAKSLFSRAVENRGQSENSLLVHADNGAPMRSQTLNAFFSQMSIVATHNRPHTSNDNAFAESIFATLKGRVLFPDYFHTLEASVSYVEEFVAWYNFDHQHSSIDYLRPFEVHFGEHITILKKRNEQLSLNRIKHPSRHGKIQKTYKVPKFVELKHRVPCKKVV